MKLVSFIMTKKKGETKRKTIKNKMSQILKEITEIKFEKNNYYCPNFLN